MGKQCAFCKRRKAKNANQIMAPLPLNRLQTSLRGFTKVAVDFGKVEEGGERSIICAYLHHKRSTWR